ncbi:MAG: prolyl oligopeptidase family serine peptidase [Antricoccus sp.]
MRSSPITDLDDTSDILHGVNVPDPYRWLEYPDSERTRQWVVAQNAYTESVLADLPARGWFIDTLNSALSKQSAGTPRKQGGWYTLTRNDGAHNQDIWYIAPSLEKLAAGGRVLIDPNLLSEQQTTAVTGVEISPDGQYAAFTVSEGGSDWQSIRVLNLQDRCETADLITQSKFCMPRWTPNSKGFVYGYFADNPDGANAGQQPPAALRYHHLGEPQENDRVIWSAINDAGVLPLAEFDDAGHWMFLHLYRGSEPVNRLWIYPIVDGECAEPIKLIDQEDASYEFVTMHGEQAVLVTNEDAPNGRVVTMDLSAGIMTEVVAECEAVIEHVHAAGDSIIVVRLQDAQPTIDRVRLGSGQITQLAIYCAEVLDINGNTDDDEIFIGSSSPTASRQSFRVNLTTGDVVRMQLKLPSIPGRPASKWLPPQTITERREARSKDGETIGYFLIRAEGAESDRPRPTILYGYGGFDIPMLAGYQPGWAAWLQAGGVLVIANLRGGGEYGRAWHDAGRLGNKQNVFDDFIAVAEELIDSSITTSGQLALHGRSNGGLLVGAVMIQRPDLAAVALPKVGVLDMLRFHKFTSGANWVSDYGSPDDPEMFEVLRAYSPLHNVLDGTAYPATLVMTGDHDDRVVPAHSYKFTAQLQHAQVGDAPILARIETATGHGTGKPRTMVVSEWADMLAFAANYTGLVPDHADKFNE